MSKRNLRISNGNQPEPARTAATSPQTPVIQVNVAELAYQRWVERGCPQGCPNDDWYEAERELRSRSAS
jgi:hypothetical protein